jgi:hypothetical protein
MSVRLYGLKVIETLGAPLGSGLRFCADWVEVSRSKDAWLEA